MCLGDVFNRNKSSAPAPTATVGDEPTIIDQSVRGGTNNSMKKGSYNQSRAGKAAAAKKSSTKKTSKTTTRRQNRRSTGRK